VTTINNNARGCGPASQTPPAAPTPPAQETPPPATVLQQPTDKAGSDPLQQAAAFIGVLMLRSMGVDSNVLSQNPELKGEVDRLMGAARGIGTALGINLDKLMLPDDMLEDGAVQALQEGRVDGKCHKKPNEAQVQNALSRDWQPVTGNPTGQTGVRPLSQLDSNATLGNGPRTIRQSGCLLTSMAMVSNSVNGTSIGLEQANSRVKSGNGFSGSNMNVGPAANALGMRLNSRASFTGNTNAMDRALEQGKPVVVGVDYKAGSSSAMGRTDHFLVVTGRNANGSYSAVDSAGGRELTFNRQANGEFVAMTPSGKRYSLSEIMTFDKR
jgi:hypothetical protein